MYRHIVFLLCALTTVSCDEIRTKVTRETTQQADQHRVALVIGNASYRNARLRNAINDASAMSRALEETGFEVTTETNLNQKGMKRAIRAFGERLSSGGVALFYYSGYGVQIKGSNYFIPIDADIRKEGDVELEAVDVNYILNEMEAAKSRMNIVILDACRDNPFPTTYRSTSMGLAQVNAPLGTIIAFAAAPGSVATDGLEQSSLYTQELVKNITVPGLPIETVFKRTLAGVKQRSGAHQIPWTSYTIEEDFYFTSPPVESKTVSLPDRDESKNKSDTARNEDKNLRPETDAERRVTSPTYLSDLKELTTFDIYDGVGHDSANWGYPLRVSGVVYRKGIVTHPDSDPGYVEYALEGQYSYFRAMIAMLDDCSAGGAFNGNAVFTVQVDGKEVFKSPMLEWDQLNKMDVEADVRGARVLRLGISNGDGKTWSDHAAWINARVE